jgi:hypothetical protein
MRPSLPARQSVLAMDASIYAIEIGYESDGELIARLHSVVIACGGSMTLAAHDVGGMEESICYDIVLPEGELEAIAETGMGLRLSGSEILVSLLVSRLTPATGST